jgi:hypothetical protein
MSPALFSWQRNVSARRELCGGPLEAVVDLPSDTQIIVTSPAAILKGAKTADER